MNAGAKTPAQRQAARAAREKAAGRRLYKRWLHPDDWPAMHAQADLLDRNRAVTTKEQR